METKKQGILGLRRKKFTFSRAQKHLIVQEYVTGILSKREIWEKYPPLALLCKPHQYTNNVRNFLFEYTGHIPALALHKTKIKINLYGKTISKIIVLL